MEPQKNLHAAIPPELLAKAQAAAEQEHITLDELVSDAMAGYFEELAQVRETLDRRYDDVKSGRVKLIPGDVVEAELRRRIEERRSRRPTIFIQRQASTLEKSLTSSRMTILPPPTGC
jgi:hypothetical protein